MKIGSCMQACVIVALISLTPACAGTAKNAASIANEGFDVRCDGAAVSIDACFEQASNLCGSAGYDLINHDKQTIPYEVATASGGQDFVNYGSFSAKSILVLCRN